MKNVTYHREDKNVGTNGGSVIGKRAKQFERTSNRNFTTVSTHENALNNARYEHWSWLEISLDEIIETNVEDELRYNHSVALFESLLICININSYFAYISSVTALIFT